jgi:hypothetical protein
MAAGAEPGADTGADTGAGGGDGEGGAALDGGAPDAAALEAEALAWARAYPFDPPRESYLFVDGEARPLDRLETEGRTPVLAIGSNRAPGQLARKYAGFPPGNAIPVVAARLFDFDVVYSSHFARYGSVPARLWPRPGVTAEVGVMWLTEPQLAHLHGTEGAANYAFGRLSGIRLEVEGTAPLTAIRGYLGKRPPVLRHGEPVALAEISAEGRTGPALAQPEALELARSLLAPLAETDAFVLEILADADLRALRSELLSQAMRRATAGR